MITLIVCIICELAWIFCYGLLLNSFLHMGVFFFAAFGIPFCVSMIFYKKLPFNDKVNKMLWVLIVSLILAGLSTLLYDAINRASGEFVAEYEVEVESCLYNDGGKAYFTAPDGEDSSVRLNDYRVITQDDDYIKEGDIITVREYVGFFRKTFFVLVKDEK